MGKGVVDIESSAERTKLLWFFSYGSLGLYCVH